MNYLLYYILGIVLIPVIIFSVVAQIKVQANYTKYSKVLSEKGYSANKVVREILNSAGLYDYKVDRVEGELTDHFNPKDKTIYLSTNVYDSTSVAALGIACHETGHALQHAENYAPMKVRQALVKVSNISSRILWPILLIGFIFSFLAFIEPFGTIILYAGVIFFGITFIINLVTLPVEYNASNRAKRLLSASGICDREEMVGVEKVLNSAALTYVAAMVTSLIYLLRFIALFSRSRD